MKFYVGVDVGGTFTDGAVVDAEGNIYAFKTPTVNKNPTEGFVNCLSKAAGFFGLTVRDFLGSVEKLTYGTTIATNILIEGRGAPVGLITTRGFKDTLPIARIGREYLGIDLQVERPPSLLPRRLIEEVSERVDYAGKEITPLSLQDVRASLDRLLAEGVEAVAVCFLWSFKNPAHEETVRKTVAARRPKLYVSISSEVAPLIGEYERTATTVMNARLGPPIKDHLSGLSRELQEKGLDVPLLIMQSSGGVTPAEDAGLRPIMLANSGPAGGVIASKRIGELLGLGNLICVDMGGTSFDASLIADHQYTSDMVSRISGHNIYVPMIDIHSIGAGGGSIAWLDEGVRLKVGPLSAGADPGPACYGKGGEEPTVTDADLVLGRLNPDYFVGGEMAIDEERARLALARHVAEPLQMDVTTAAAGICRIVDANMANAIRVITVQKGYDPRDYAMVAFGGAGPVHAAALAKELGVRTVIVPQLATVQSAFGIVSSDIVHTFSMSDVMPLESAAAVNAHFARLESQGRELLVREGIAEEQIEVIRYADLRYRGQAHEVSLVLPSGTLTEAELLRVGDRFEEKYETLYGRGTAFREVGIEIVTLRVDVVGHTRKPIMREHAFVGTDASGALKCRRPVYFEDAAGFVTTPVYDGEKLQYGNRFDGPAVVEYVGTTAVIHPGQKAEIDGYLDLIITSAEC